MSMRNANQTRKENQHPPKKTVKDYKLACTHLIDGVYEGIVNASYQRDGFGILQTDDFQTYMGYFKYNKPNGLGLIIYTDGSMIYANFHNGLLEGIGLADNGHQIQVGTFRGTDLVGVGFEYSYKTSRWKMNRYHKGVSIDIIKQEQMPLNEGIPNILTLQSDILCHYLNYTKKKYFSKSDLTNGEGDRQDLNSFYIHKLSEDQYFFGSMMNSRCQGLGLIYNIKNMSIREIGTYRDGVLNGFAMKIDENRNHHESGFYSQGKKEGVFCITQEGKVKFSQFKKDHIILEDKRGQSKQNMKKQQKIYYYRQKDFLSTRNNLNIYSFKAIFQSSQYKAWKIQEQNDKKQKNDQQKQSGEVKTNKAKSSTGPNISTIQGLEKTSLQIMKEKIFGLLSQGQSKKNKNIDKANLLFQKDNSDIEKGSTFEKRLEDDEIANQQNPVKFLSPDIEQKRKSVTFQSHDRKYR